MMQTFREKIQGIVAGIIVAVIALTFALWGIQNYLHGGSGDAPLATVNGAKITQEQLRVAYERTKREQMAHFGADFFLDQKNQAMLKKQTLDVLIHGEVLNAAVKNMGFNIGVEQLGIIIKQLPIFQENGRFSAERMQEVLSNLFYSEEAFVAEIENSFMLLQLQQGISASEFVLPDELTAIKRFDNQKRDFWFLIINKDKFIDSIKVSQDEVHAYYKAHQDDFLIPEKVSIQYLQLSADDLAKTIIPTKAQLLQYYNEHINSFGVNKNTGYDAVALKVRQAYIHQELMQKFADLNDKLTDLTYTSSDSLMPAAKALDLDIKETGLVTSSGAKEGVLANPKIIKAAFSEQVLKQGYNSSPIELSSGVVIVLRIKTHIPESPQPFDQVSMTITQKLQKQRAQEKAIALGQEILTDLHHNLTMSALSNKYDLAQHNLSNVGRDNKNVPKEILQQAFNALPAEAQLVKMPNDDVAIFAVTKIMPGAVGANDQVSDALLNETINNIGKSMYSMFVADLMKQAKIKIENDNNKIQ